MPKIDISALPLRTGTGYPEPLRDMVKGRERKALGDAAGLTQFGVNYTRLKPGAASAHRHWHETEDELVYVLEGELVLVEDDGETTLRAGDAAAFKAGVDNGHHLVNRSGRDALLLGHPLDPRALPLHRCRPRVCLRRERQPLHSQVRRALLTCRICTAIPIRTASTSSPGTCPAAR